MNILFKIRLLIRMKLLINYIQQEKEPTLTLSGKASETQTFSWRVRVDLLIKMNKKKKRLKPGVQRTNSKHPSTEFSLHLLQMFSDKLWWISWKSVLKKQAGFTQREAAHSATYWSHFGAVNREKSFHIISETISCFRETSTSLAPTGSAAGTKQIKSKMIFLK